MPNFKKSPAGGPSAMKMYGKGKNPIMMKSPAKNKISKTYKALKKSGDGNALKGLVNTVTDSYKKIYNDSGIVINKSNKNPKGKKFKYSNES